MDSLYRPFGEWHQRSFYQVLHRNMVEIESKGISYRSLIDVVRPKRPKDTDNSIQAMAREKIQKAFSKFSAEERIRHKITRWKLRDPPGHMARRIYARLDTLRTLCRPCVVSGFLRTLWNGWPTSRRMRTMRGAPATSSCAFGCKDREDSVEHYLLCPVAWAVLEGRPPRGLGLREDMRNLSYMLLSQRGMSDEEIAAIAVACYGIARTVHCLKISPAAKNAAAVLRLYLAEGMKGCKAKPKDS